MLIYAAFHPYGNCNAVDGVTGGALPRSGYIHPPASKKLISSSTKLLVNYHANSKGPLAYLVVTIKLKHEAVRRNCLGVDLTWPRILRDPVSPTGLYPTSGLVVRQPVPLQAPIPRYARSIRPLARLLASGLKKRL